MTMLDNLISESGSRFGIGSAAKPLVRELLQLMTGAPGGLEGFLDRFRKAGMGREVASYVGGKSETPLPSKEVVAALGETTVADMAQHAGLAPAETSRALGFAIPKAIGLLTPGGTMPTKVPAEIRTFVTEPDQVRPEATATIRESAQVRPAAMATLREAEQVRPSGMATVGTRRPGISPWLWPLLAIALVGGLIWALLSRTPHRPAPTAPAVPAAPPVATAPPAMTAPPGTTAVTPTPSPGPAAAEVISALNQELNLNFQTGSAQLPAASRPLLQRAASQINSLPAGTVIEIAGNTDNVGNPAANMSLSQRRADAVRDGLVQAGVNPSMLTARGYGTTNPKAPNDTPEGRSTNRRTEFSVISTGR
jgi:outer membrane protein OmpA-like peptidoglycan-associated protein/uncharacterized protein YidB (DUF937 family)